MPTMACAPNRNRSYATLMRGAFQTAPLFVREGSASTHDLCPVRPASPFQEGGAGRTTKVTGESTAEVNRGGRTACVRLAVRPRRARRHDPRGTAVPQGGSASSNYCFLVGGRPRLPAAWAPSKVSRLRKHFKLSLLCLHFSICALILTWCIRRF